MPFAAGIDVGSTQTKAVLVDTSRSLVARTLILTGANVKLAGQRALDAIVQEAGIRREEVGFVVGTGYGRYKIEAGNAQVTEISCHARGAQFIFPGTRTVVDMGGQDTKAIKVGPEGNVLDFCMNDKCAAGTGRFLAGAADCLGLPLDDIGEISLKGTKPIRLTSVCTVFVESDIMSYMAQRKKVEDILAGVHQAIAGRTIGLLRRVGAESEVTFTGGVALNVGMVRALEEKLQMPLNVGPESHFMGALGAALFALDHVLAAEAESPHPAIQAATWSDG
jgi:(R)-2-hydroxyacyl-CoA dehydratese activating ATPase